MRASINSQNPLANFHSVSLNLTVFQVTYLVSFLHIHLFLIYSYIIYMCCFLIISIVFTLNLSFPQKPLIILLVNFIQNGERNNTFKMSVCYYCWFTQFYQNCQSHDWPLEVTKRASIIFRTLGHQRYCLLMSLSNWFQNLN